MARLDDDAGGAAIVVEQHREIRAQRIDATERHLVVRIRELGIGRPFVRFALALIALAYVIQWVVNTGLHFG